MPENPEFAEASEALDLDRTGTMFDSLIIRAGVNETSKLFDAEEQKKTRLALAAGNLHAKTAQIKLGAIRLAGYVENKKKLREAIQNKVKDAMRPVDGQ